MGILYLHRPFPPACRGPLSNTCSIHNRCNHGPVVLRGTLPGGCTYICPCRHYRITTY
nr:MAG TPA: hypothetical protein [Caudoviricetes sp.]